MERQVPHSPSWLLSKAERTSAIYTMNIKKEKLLNYLSSIAGSKTISGIFQEHSSTEELPSKGIQTVQTLTGVYPGIVTTRMPSFSDDASHWQFFVNETIYNWRKGSLVNIVWFDDQHPLAANEMISVIFKRTPNVDPDDAKWKSLIETGGVLNTLWKQHLDVIAPFLVQLQKAGVIVICDLLPFLHLKHLFWRGRPGLDGTSKLYQITQDYLKSSHGLHSMVWMWSLHHCGDMTRLQEYWPGDEYVDVASFYMGDTKELGSGVYQNILDIINGKPISLECSYSIPAQYLLFLHIQPRWTWFTTYDYFLQNKKYNSNERIKNVFHNLSIINGGNFELSNLL